MKIETKAELILSKFALGDIPFSKSYSSFRLNFIYPEYRAAPSIVQTKTRIKKIIAKLATSATE